MENDWTEFFLPAAQNLWRGISPYTIPLLFNPPWTFFLLLPAGLLPDTIGRLIGFILPALALAIAAHARRKPYLIAIVGLSFPFIALSSYGNVDWMVLLGVVIRGPFSLFLLTTKPQAGALAAVAQLKDKTWRERALLVLPLLVVSGICILIFPDWITSTLFAARYGFGVHNFSLFPYTIPLAIPLLWLCYQRKDPLYGTLASLCLAPYFYIHSVVPALFLLADHNWKWGIAAVIIIWIVIGLIMAQIIPIGL